MEKNIFSTYHLLHDSKRLLGTTRNKNKLNYEEDGIYKGVV
jgi:hypothetical protein